MSEEIERGREDAGDPIAISMALGGADREEANAFLRKQAKLADLQAKELAHELELRHWSLWVRHLSGLLKLTFEVSVALLALALVGGAGVMVWNAAHANGLIVESFKVPPDLAEKGLTGEVVATRLLDNLSSMQAQSTSVRAASSYANNWGDDLKVEIPETGVSLGEFNRYLRRWLGHETHISGEVVRVAGGNIEITARTNSEAGQSVSGSELEFQALLAKAAEAIYRDTQPIRYSNILFIQGRLPEEEALLRANTRTGPVSERVWAYAQLTGLLASRDRTGEAIRAGRAAIALNPRFAYGWYRMAVALERAGVPQGALDAAKKSLSLARTGTADILPETLASMQAVEHMVIAEQLGDFDQQIAQFAATYPTIDFSADPATQTQQAATATGGGVRTPIAYQGTLALARIGQHDLRAARRVLAEAPSYIAAMNTNLVAGRQGRTFFLDRAAETYRNVELALAVETGSWTLVRQMVPPMEAEAARRAAAHLGNYFNPRAQLWPNLALAEAQIGDFAAAHAQIDRTASDCDQCLRTRAKIDALQKNPGGADFWFAKAEGLAPSIPFADQDWGRELLARGDADGAIGKFQSASQKGPHFADPLEGWGEALMAKRQSHLALAKFAEAGKYAPNWGRLHLKWGEALTYAGKNAEAQKQFARAAQLDLTPSEKSELAKVGAHG